MAHANQYRTKGGYPKRQKDPWVPDTPPKRPESPEPICVRCEKPGSKCDCEPHGEFV